MAVRTSPESRERQTLAPWGRRRLRPPCETRCQEAGGGFGKELQGTELINPKAASLDHFGSEMTVLIQEDLLIPCWSLRERREAKNMLNSSELKKALSF